MSCFARGLTQVCIQFYQSQCNSCDGELGALVLNPIRYSALPVWFLRPQMVSPLKNRTMSHLFCSSSFKSCINAVAVTWPDETVTTISQWLRSLASNTLYKFWHHSIFSATCSQSWLKFPGEDYPEIPEDYPCINGIWEMAALPLTKFL